MSMIQNSIMKSIDAINTIDKELPMLLHRDKLVKEGKSPHPEPPKEPAGPLKVLHIPVSIYRLYRFHNRNLPLKECLT